MAYSVSSKIGLGNSPQFTVVASMSLALFMLGLFGVLFSMSSKLSAIIRQNMEVQVYLERDASPSLVDSIRMQLATQPFVAKLDEGEAITFVSREEAAKSFIAETGEDFVKFLGENPLRHAFRIKIDQSYAEGPKLAAIKQQLEEQAGIFEVAYVENLVENVNNNLNQVAVILVGFSVVLVLAALLLIRNTIKLSVYSQRFLIRSMQLVGADPWFIKRPFVVQCGIQGLMAGFVAVVTLALLMQWGLSQIADLQLVVVWYELALISTLLLVLGALIGLLSAWTSVTRFLRLSLDQLY